MVMTVQVCDSPSMLLWSLLVWCIFWNWIGECASIKISLSPYCYTVATMLMTYGPFWEWIWSCVGMTGNEKHMVTTPMSLARPQWPTTVCNYHPHLPAISWVRLWPRAQSYWRQCPRNSVHPPCGIPWSTCTWVCHAAGREPPCNWSSTQMVCPCRKGPSIKGLAQWANVCINRQQYLKNPRNCFMLFTR